LCPGALRFSRYSPGSRRWISNCCPALMSSCWRISAGRTIWPFVETVVFMIGKISSYPRVSQRLLRQYPSGKRDKTWPPLSERGQTDEAVLSRSFWPFSAGYYAGWVGETGSASGGRTFAEVHPPIGRRLDQGTVGDHAGNRCPLRSRRCDSIRR